MKAIILNEFGAVDNLEMKEISTPVIKDDEVLVKVKTISINPVDVKLRAGGAQIRGQLMDSIKNDPPMILGWDISGEIVEVGKSAEGYAIGNEVFTMVNFVGHGKAYAEYVAVPANQLALKPKNISHDEAASATLAALTAWQAFTKHGRLNMGGRVLIHAAAGGVGHYAVQLAKYLGAYVVGTSSSANKDFVLGLGADEHIDYRNEIVEDVAKDIDFVLETIGSENLDGSLELVKQGGTVIVINAPSGFSKRAESLIAEKNINCIYMTVESNGEDMRIIASLLEQGIVKSHVFKTFAFDQMADAHLQVETGRTVGKVVVTI